MREEEIPLEDKQENEEIQIVNEQPLDLIVPLKNEEQIPDNIEESKDIEHGIFPAQSTQEYK